MKNYNGMGSVGTGIERVHVVFMTHFDLGFTHLADTILNRYTHEFIPQAVELAERLNRDGEKRFVWTIGAFLIDHCLKAGREETKEKLKAAIKRGDICWHGLAFTTHTELMDGDLMHYDLGYSDRLDQQFGKKTVGAKLTDVPGHTKAMIPYLTGHGKNYLHIGVNQSSMIPQVPPTFLWKNKEAEIVVQYSESYGDTCYVNGMKEVLEFVFLGDNLGIPSEEEVLKRMEEFKRKYPGAKVEAGSLDDYANALYGIKENLPVVTEEIGDSWIHGVASDPWKVMNFRKMLELKNSWKREGRFDPEAPEYADFMEQILLLCEHTWGLDYKKYLYDFTNWTKEEFREARKRDLVTDELFTLRNEALRRAVLEELHKEALTGSYSFYESSYQEQRSYISTAIQALPGDQREEVQTMLAGQISIIKKEEAGESDFMPGERIALNGWTAVFDQSGAMVLLEREGREWIRGGCFGRLSYETYNAKNCISEYYEYNRSFRENMVWSEADFSKPGLEVIEDLEQKNIRFQIRKIFQEGNEIVLMLEGDRESADLYGCPREAVIRYRFDKEVKCRLIWKKKDANKMPEALWLDCQFGTDNPSLWMLQKMGEKISPLHVVKGGNRRQHCTERLSYEGADGSLEIINHDAPLVSVGGRRLYGGCLELPDLKEGFAYCLFNNKWGTNFPMWCEDDCLFDFTISLNSNI